MAKNKRTISSSQRDKLAIETAKILKKKGVLSKQTKLHGGKYISRGVLKKVQELQHVARSEYRALKVSKDIARQAKAEGYQVVQGNRVVVPAEHDFIKRVRAGMVSGIKPVRGGFMSEVVIPFEVNNVAELIHKLEYEDVDNLKLPHEQFAFSIDQFDSEGNRVGSAMSYRAFPSTDAMRDYFRHYKPELQTSAVKFFRLHPSDVHQFIKGPSKRQKFRSNDRRASAKTYAERMRRMEEVNPKRAEKIKEQSRQKSARRREALASDPTKREAYLARGRERARKSYQKRKGSK